MGAQTLRPECIEEEVRRELQCVCVIAWVAGGDESGADTAEVMLGIAI